MLISGFQKLTLLDFPGETACTLFTPGCNFRCPFCHNALLVTDIEDSFISEDEVFAFLKKRVGILDGVCVTGGEPTLQKDIRDFLRKIKNMGFSVKLDTNGHNPELLREIINEGLCDYVAMDIKNTKEKYSETSGCQVDTDRISESVEILKNAPIPCEFRTTVVKELHTEDDLLSIARWIKSSRPYYLQQFKDSGNLIKSGLNPFTKEEMHSALEKVKEIISDTHLRES